jgi:DNA-binding MarR family transcriptional regulator
MHEHDFDNGYTGWDVGRTLWGVLNALFDHAEPVMAQYGLHQKALVLLAVLEFKDTPQELAHLLRTPPSSLSYLLREMEAKGLIARSVDTHDKRKFRFVRTPLGEEGFRAGREAINEAVAERLSDLSEAERAVLIQALPLLNRLL